MSGAVSPFDRAGLGPYLREPLLSTWQVLVVFRLDRLTRSIADFETVWKFLEANGKTLVSVAEQIDFGTTAGRLMARQLVIFAEYEREMIKARVKNAYDAARGRGKYPGMMFPFGYIPVKLPEKGWGLDHHPVYADIVVEIVERVLGGESLGSESLSSICRWLDEAGIPTSRNVVRQYGNAIREQQGKKPKPLKDAKWNTTSLTAILKSPAIIGEVTVTTEGKDEEGKYINLKNAKALRDDSGIAIKRAEPLISREKWEQVKELLAQNATRTGPNVNRAPLLQVAFCANCRTPLNLTSSSWNGKQYRYYRCPNERLKRGCDAKRIPVEELESTAESMLLDTYGTWPLTEITEIAGIDYSTQMHELAEAIGDLSTKIALARVTSQDVSGLEEQRRIHEQNLTALAGKKVRPPERNERPTGQTFADRWQGLDWNGRNDLLRRNSIKLYAKKQADGFMSVVSGAGRETFTDGEYFKTLHDLTHIRT